MAKDKIVERTEGDDILDALSLRINSTLKTEKKIDDQKNNMYFWLFKFIVLAFYLLIINGVFTILREIGVDLIYSIAVSLRGILSLIWTTIIEFARWLLTLYLLFKNLKIFMNSSYYKRLYVKDQEMNKKKKKFFNTTSSVLKYLSVPFLLFLCISIAFLLAFLTLQVYMLINGMYSASLILITVILTFICYSIFRNIQYKFFNLGSIVRKRTIAIMSIFFLFSLLLFSYETSGYEVNSTLPTGFKIENKIMYFDVMRGQDIILKSGSKYENIHVYTDDTLVNQIRVELEYFDTANANYTYYFNDNDDLFMEFNSELDFHIKDFDYVLKLVIDTIRDKTLYNYNLFKYPTINVYVSSDYLNDVTLLDYDNNQKEIEV